MAAVKTVTLKVDVNTGEAIANVDNLKTSLSNVGGNAKKGADGVERLAKNGGAIGILNDLTGGLASRFKDAYESISLTNTGLKGTKAAIAATGIGLLVLAIGALVANMDKVVGYFNKASDAATELAKASEDVAVASEKNLETLMASDNILRYQGLSEKEILQTKIEQTKATIKANQVALEGAIEVRKQTIANAEANQLFMFRVLQGLTVPIRFMLEQVDLVGKALGQNFGLVDKLNAGLWSASSAIFDPAKIKQEGEAADIEAQAQLLKLENDWKGFELNLTSIEKAEQDKREQQEKEAFDRRKKNHLDFMDGVTQQQRDAATKQQAAEQDAAHQSGLARIKTIQTTNADIASEMDKARQTEIDSIQALQELRQQLETNGFAALEVLAGKNKKAQKLLAVAQIAFETGKGFIQGLSVAQQAAMGTGPAAAYSFPIFYGSQIAAVLAAAGKAKAALNGGGGGGGGGGGRGIGSSSSATPPAAPVTPVNFDFLKNQPAMKSYVLTDDVKRAGEANQKIKDLSTL